MSVYMPILKTKKGEWEALKHLVESDRELIFPLIQCTTLQLSSQQAPADLVKEHLEEMAERLDAAGAKNHVFGVDTSSLLPTLPSQAKLLVAACRRLRQDGLRIAPCILPSMVADAPSDLASLAEYGQIIIRVPVRDYLPTQISQLLLDARNALGSKRVHIHVLLDLFDLTGGNPHSVASSMKPYASAALGSSHAYSVTVAGGSFPYFLTGIPRGQTKIDRIEWLVWQSLLQDPAFHALRFGDYAVTNPKPLEIRDPTQLNASAAIRYARENHWVLIKAGGTRTGGYGQYNALCKLLIMDKFYSGQHFSYGDAKYYHHAQPGSTSGNLWTWRRDATSHHLALTAREYAKLSGQ